MKLCRFALSSIAISLAIGACQQTFQNELETVEQLQKRIEISKKQFDTIDSSDINSAYVFARGKIGTIQDTYILSRDTMDLHKAQLLNTYANLTEPLRHSAQVYSSTRDEILLTEKLLNNLKHDLKRNLLSEEAVNSAIDTETKAVKQIEEAITQLKFEAGIATDSLPEYNARLDSIFQLDNTLVQ